MDDVRPERGMLTERAVGLTRRKVLVTSAWAAPTIVIASGTPAFAASSGVTGVSILPNWQSGTATSYTTGTSTRYRIRFHIDNSGIGNANLSNITYTMTITEADQVTPYTIDPGSMGTNKSSTGLHAVTGSWGSPLVVGNVVSYSASGNSIPAGATTYDASLDLLINPRINMTTRVPPWSASVTMFVSGVPVTTGSVGVNTN